MESFLFGGCVFDLDDLFILSTITKSEVDDPENGFEWRKSTSETGIKSTNGRCAWVKIFNVLGVHPQFYHFAPVA